MGVFALGPNVGILLGFGFGGAIGQAWGWRAALVAAGAAGLALAVLSAWLLKDPRRAHGGEQRGDRAQRSVAAELRGLFRHPAMRHLFIGGTLMGMATYAAIGWLPAFLIRSHGFGTAAAGLALAVLLGAVGALGTLLGGLLADRLGARDPAWRLRVVPVAILVAAPFWLAALLVPHGAGVLALLVVPAAMLCFYLAPTFAAVQSLADPSARALAAALLLLVSSLVALGLGPLLVGVLSDALRPAHGADSLRLGLLVVVPIMLWSAAHYFAAGRALR
jgi:predicted MFS family arabinose efflux permease